MQTPRHGIEASDQSLCETQVLLVVMDVCDQWLVDDGSFRPNRETEPWLVSAQRLAACGWNAMQCNAMASAVVHMQNLTKG